jgi:two-component system, NtrC family, nitrogen regulation response regulator NtrX
MTKTILAKILIVDDEPAIRRAFKSVLEHEPYDIDEAFDGVDCLEKLKQKSYDIIFLDIKMPRKDGVETLSEIIALYPTLSVVMISGNNDIRMAVTCIRQGAADYMVKPFDIFQLFSNIKNTLNDVLVPQKNKRLRTPASQVKLNKHIIGKSEKVKEMNRHIALAAKYDKTDVLILGPNGSGKELVAQALHQQSSRSQGPFIEINCAAIPDTLIDGTLFGHVKNTFTDAKEDRKSKFEEADGGTIFLDEIGDMSSLAQLRLLRLLETRTVIRVGGTKTIPFNTRIISATNKNLREEVAKGYFRLDLFNRLNKLIVEVPSLNERTDDIPPLIEFFKQQFYENYKDAPPKQFDEETITYLQSLDWAGNIRELKNAVDRLIIYTDDSDTIQEADAKRYLAMGS